MSGTTIDPTNYNNLFAFISQQFGLWNSMFSDPRQAMLLQQSYGQFGADAIHLAGSTQVQAQTGNQAYIIEDIKMQIAAAVRNAQIQGKAVADFAQFLDPSRVPLGDGVQKSDLTQLAAKFFEFDKTSLSQNIRLGHYDLGISGTTGFYGPNTMGPLPSKNEALFLGNRVTGNGLTIDGDVLTFNVGGQLTTGSLKEVLKITAQNKTGTINLENGTKMTFSFEYPAGATDPKLDKIFITNPDGSYAEIKAKTDPATGKIVYEPAETGKRSEDLAAFKDNLIPDGTSLFLSPEAAALHSLNPLTGEFTGVLGDSRALALGLRAASFGGNLYNFYFSAADGGYHAQQMMPQFMSFAGIGPDGWPQMPPGFPPMFGDDGFVQDGFMPVNCPPGLNPPPQAWNPMCNWGPSVDPVIGDDKIEDLIMEDMTGKDKTGALQQAKDSFLKYQLKYGRMDFETKLMVLLYLFLDDNGKEIDQIFKKLSGVGEDELVNGRKTPKQNFTRQNIEGGNIKDQIDFWSNYRPNNLSRDTNRRNEQLSQNATMVNGKIKSLEVDQSLLQARLTNLIRDRQRMIETVTNAMKALDDALANTVRRIV